MGGALLADSQERSGCRISEPLSRMVRLSGDELEVERARESFAEIGGSRVGKKERLGEAEDVEKAFMVGNYHWREAELTSRYDEYSCMRLVEALGKWHQTIQPPSLRKLSRDWVRTFLDEFKECKSQLAHVARSVIPVVPAGVLGTMGLC